MADNRAGRICRLARRGHFWQGTFLAMGSPCELLCDAPDEPGVRRLLELVAREAWRVEDKFSRYLPGNIVATINGAAGSAVEVDEETADLLDFAASMHRLSDGMFDITSGVLGRLWKFDGGDYVPTSAELAPILRLVGWQKARWQRPVLELLPGMRIDLGGLGKEYAVDRAAALAAAQTTAGCLVNFGGDLVATRPPAGRPGWQVGIEAPQRAGGGAERLIRLTRGALATSGDARRFVAKDGVRYGHILNPLSGRPVEGAPRSVTVAADTCMQAGMLATLAMLRGEAAEAFLAEQAVDSWCLR